MTIKVSLSEIQKDFSSNVHKGNYLYDKDLVRGLNGKSLVIKTAKRHWIIVAAKL